MIRPYHQYSAELVGTFTLTLAVYASLTSTLPFATPIVAGLTLGLMIYTVGKISGGHLNPAVTVALASLKKINLKDSGFYILAQFAGMGLAVLLGNTLFGSLPTIVATDSVTVLMAEIVGTAILLFGICTAVRNNHYGTSGLIIGGSLLLGVLVAMGASNGVLNPAVAVGIGSISATYFIGPVIGALLGAWLNAWLNAEV